MIIFTLWEDPSCGIRSRGQLVVSLQSKQRQRRPVMRQVKRMRERLEGRRRTGLPGRCEA